MTYIRITPITRTRTIWTNMVVLMIMISARMVLIEGLLGILEDLLGPLEGI